MKQWKRLAALSSAIVMAAATLTYFPSDTLQNIRLEISASAETTTEPQVWIEDNLTWTLTADGTLTISGTGAMKDYNAAENLSPAYMNSDVKKVVIEDGVTSIGELAFYKCSSLTNITIPDSVTCIEYAAFHGCSSLSSITIPNSVTSIGIYAFVVCSSLTSITIPDGVTSIGYGAFSDCSSLKTISLSCKSSLKKSDFGEQADLVSYTNQHTLTKTEAKAATCTENGNKEYWTCEHCKKYFLSDDTNPETAKAVEQSETILPAIQHKNAELRNSSEPTETAPGYSGDLYCPDCDTVFEKGYTYWNEDNLTWTLDADGTLTISGTGAMKDYDYYNNPSPASQKKDSVKKVVIEDGVTSIRNSAFYDCNSLTSITIPNSVTSIGAYAFSNCYYLTNITIPNSVTSIENYAFRSCSSLTSITIPDSVTSIGELAFYSCDRLTSITISNSVTSIGERAFAYCSRLNSITIPDSVTSIGEAAFAGCSSLTSITIPDSVTSIGEYAFQSCSSLTSITIPDSVTSIGDYVFISCSSLTTISLSCKSSLKRSDFGGQADLVSYTLHTLKKTEAKAATCTEDGNKEYWTCEHCGKYFLSDDANPETAKAVEQSETILPASHKLTKVKEEKAPTCTEDGNKEYWTCEHCGKYFLSDDTNPETAKAVELSETILPAIQHKNAELRNASEPTETSPGYSGDLYCPDCDKVVEKGYTYWNEGNLTWKLYEDGTLNISGTGAMKNYYDNKKSPVYNNSNVKKVVIEDGVTSIGNYAFTYCVSLTSITIPDSVTSIGYYAFFYCSSLTSITISDSVTSIGNYAFFYCRSLTSITIPDSVTSIGSYAFSECRSLTSITIPDSVTSIGRYAFENCSSLKTISLGCGSALKKSDFGKQADLVSYTSHVLKKTEAKAATCTENGNKEYWTCEHCGKYFLSDDANPETAKAVELSETILPAIQHKNAELRNASEPTETSPGYSGDLYCPDCDKVVEKGYTYWNEDNLTWKLDADGTLTISGTGAMKNYYDNKKSPVYKNSNVKKVVIEDGVTSIGNYAFTYCVSLTSITIPDSVTSIGYYAFFYCSSLTSITISDSVTSIGNYAFFYCRSLTSITIPDSVTSIGNDAFSNCRSLTSITIPDSVTSIGYNAFYGCSNLKTISLSCKSSLKRSDFGGQADLVSYTSHTLTKTEAKAATCTEDGNKEYWTCEYCKKYFLSDDTNPETAKAVEQSETVIPASHKLTKVDAKAVTCTEDGNKEYWTCEHCGKYFLSDDANPETAKAVEQSETIIPASHKLTKVKEEKAPTCTEDGNKEYWTCEHCGKYFLSDDTNPETAKAVELSETILPAIQHKNAELRNASEPTETSPGYSGDLYCPDCDKVVEKGYTYWNEDNLTWKLDADGTLTISGTGAMKNYNYYDNPSPASQKKGSVKKVVIKDGVTSIGDYAFRSCNNLTSIMISNSVTSIGNSAFFYCTSLTSVTIPDNVTSIENYAFAYTGLKSITIPDSVTNIGNYAFAGCKDLTSITIPDSVTSIGNYAFYNCSSLTSITIPDSVTSIENYAFAYTGLKSITIPDSVTNIGNYAFAGCKDLTSITIPDSVTSIGNYAFYNCSSLTSITIPDSVTSIGDNAFNNCTNLTTISLSCGSVLKKSDFGKQADLVSYTNQHLLTKTAAKDATCTEDGNKEYWTCEHCGKYFLSDDTNPETAKAVELSETVIPASHKLTKVEAKDATYAENGNKAYWTCEHCKKYFLSDDTNPETATAVKLSETVIPALVQVATATTPIKCVYGQDMNKIDLRNYVKNTDVVGEVTVKVAAGSTLPDGMKLDGSKLSGKPAKAYEDGKEVTFTFTAENGSTANLTLLFLVAKADPTVEVSVSGDLHTEGDLVKDLELILSGNSTKGVVELVSEIKALVAGKNTFTWKFMPEDENNYNMVTGTVVVNAQTTTTTTTTTKATTTTTKATTTTNATTTTKPSKTTTTTKATTTTKPKKTTTTKVTTTTKPSKTTTTKVTTTTKPSKTTTTKVTTTTVTTTTKPSKTTTTNATTTNTAIPSYGDVNLDGKVDIVDAIFLNKYLATLIQFSDAQMANADCYQDGVLNAQDTTALMQFIILLIDDLPVQPTEK